MFSWRLLWGHMRLGASSAPRLQIDTGVHAQARASGAAGGARPTTAVACLVATLSFVMNVDDFCLDSTADAPSGRGGNSASRGEIFFPSRSGRV
eukprot:1158084-Prymnesium_polylepis.1